MILCRRDAPILCRRDVLGRTPPPEKRRRSIVGLLSLLFAILASGTSSVKAQDVGGYGLSGTKDHLDLPFDAKGEYESEEDAPETVTLYGKRLEGDGFFFVVDRSSTMQSHGELARAKGELKRIGDGGGTCPPFTPPKPSTFDVLD